MTVYCNEHDPYCAQWLRNLIAAGHLPDGVVDERDIREVEPDDVAGFAQAHFFAGIGGFPYACRLARWPEHRELWTGGFPCQDISAASAGRAKGLDGERSGLWHVWARLIAAVRPTRILIENSPRLRTLGADRVLANLEATGYTATACVVGAVDVHAPHIRKRTWIVADADGAGLRKQPRRSSGSGRQDTPVAANDTDTDIEGESRFAFDEEMAGKLEVSRDTDRQRLAVGQSLGSYACAQLAALERAVGSRGYQWNGRPDRHFSVAYGLSARLARACTHALGNAIVPQVAAEILKAWMECAP